MSIKLNIVSIFLFLYDISEHLKPQDHHFHFHLSLWNADIRNEVQKPNHIADSHSNVTIPALNPLFPGLFWL